MPLRAIEPQRRYEQVADQIAGLIRAGVWKPGDRLPPERDLAARLHVSRPTIRESMVALELAGLVEVRTGSGTYVRTGQIEVLTQTSDAGPSPFEILEARRVIEGESAALAAASATPDDMDGLQAAIDKMTRDIEAGVQGLARDDDGDWQFHVRLTAATGNATLESIVSQLWTSMRRPIFRAFSERANLPENARQAVAEHGEILGCLRAGDSAAARAAMHGHIDTVRAVLMRGVAEDDR